MEWPRLAELMQVYRRGLVRKAQALRTAVAGIAPTVRQWENIMSSDFDDRPRPDNSNKTLLIVFGVVGGVLLLCCGGGVIFFIFVSPYATLGSNANGTFTYVGTAISAGSTAVSAARPDAEKFLDALGAGRIEQAYEKLSASRRGLQPLEDFRAEIAKHPALGNQKSFSLQETAATPASAFFKVKVTGRAAPDVSATLRLVQEQGEWRVDQFDIIAPAAPKP